MLLISGITAFSQQMPKGVKIDTIHCTYASGRSAHNFYKNNELIGVITPSDCFYSETEGGRVNPICFAEFYITQVKDTFNRKKMQLIG